MALLHQRIEFLSAEPAAMIDALKAKLSAIVAPVRVPDLMAGAAVAATSSQAAAAGAALAAAAGAHVGDGASMRAAQAHLELRTMLTSAMAGG